VIINYFGKVKDIIMESKKCYLLYQKNESNGNMKLLSVYNTEEDAIFVSELKSHNEKSTNNGFTLEDGCVYSIIEASAEKCFGHQLPSVKLQVDSITEELDKLLSSMNYGEGKIE
jgi:hypothetical protein